MCRLVDHHLDHFEGWNLVGHLELELDIGILGAVEGGSPERGGG